MHSIKILLLLVPVLLQLVKAQQIDRSLNDVCAEADSLSLPVDIEVENCAGAVPPFSDSECGVTGSDPGVWFKVTTSESKNVRVVLNHILVDDYASIFTGSCDSLQCYEEIESGVIKAPYQTLYADQPWYIFVFGDDCPENSFQLSIDPFDRPENDVCSGETLLTSSPGSNSATGQIIEGALSFPLELDVTCDDEERTGKGLWYAFQPTETAEYTAVVSDHGVAGSFFILSGPCSSLTCEVYVDALCYKVDDPINPTIIWFCPHEVPFVGIAGVQYHLVIWMDDPVFGPNFMIDKSFRLNITKTGDAPTATPTPAPTPAPATPPQPRAPTSGPSAAPAPTTSPRPTSVRVPTKSPTPAPSQPPTSVLTKSPTAAPTLWCFSGQTTVDVLEGGPTRMDALQIGDAVRTADGSYSTVLSFGHFAPNDETEFLQISMSRRRHMPLEITADHMLYEYDEVTRKAKLLPAKHVKIGTSLLLEDGPSRVVDVRLVTRRGAYSPLTLKGDIAVNSVLASNSIALQVLEPYLSYGRQHSLQRAGCLPYLIFCGLSGGCKNETYDETTGLSKFAAMWLPLLRLLEHANRDWMTFVVHLVVASALGYCTWKKKIISLRKSKSKTPKKNTQGLWLIE